MDIGLLASLLNDRFNFFIKKIASPLSGKQAMLRLSRSTPACALFAVSALCQSASVAAGAEPLDGPARLQAVPPPRWHPLLLLTLWAFPMLLWQCLLCLLHSSAALCLCAGLI